MFSNACWATTLSGLFWSIFFANISFFLATSIFGLSTTLENSFNLISVCSASSMICWVDVLKSICPSCLEWSFYQKGKYFQLKELIFQEQYFLNLTFHTCNLSLLLRNVPIRKITTRDFNNPINLLSLGSLDSPSHNLKFSELLPDFKFSSFKFYTSF